MIFDRNFFIKQRFNPEELEKYKKSASRNLNIAKSGREPEVIFHFAYMALIKIGICCLYRLRPFRAIRPKNHFTLQPLPICNVLPFVNRQS